MTTTLPKLRQNLWIVAIMFFVVTDITTTWLGMYTPGVYEINPIAQEYYNNNNIVALLFMKLSFTVIVYWVDVIMYKYFGNWAFPIIPIFLAYVGILATMNNMIVLQNMGANPNIIAIAVIIPSLYVVHLAKVELGYEP